MGECQWESQTETCKIRGKLCQYRLANPWVTLRNYFKIDYILDDYHEQSKGDAIKRKYALTEWVRKHKL